MAEGIADLDKPLSGLAKNRLEELGKLALESGTLVKVKTPTCAKATGSGTMEAGSV